MTNKTLAQNALFQLTGVGVVETDMATGCFRRANQTFCEMVGYNETELKAMTYLELTHPDDWERDAENFAALQRREPREGTALTRVLHKDGSVVWLELHVTLLEVEGDVTNIAVVNDVTERERAEAALRASEEQLRLAVEAGQIGTCDWHYPGDRQNWNERRFQMYGLEPHDRPVRFEEFFALVHPDDRERVRTEITRGVEERGEHAEEYRVVRPDGSVCWIVETGRVVERQEGKPLRVISVLFDITERKRAEAGLQELNETLEEQVEERTEALAHSEKRFSQAFYVNPIPACMMTFGLKDETFVEVNDALLELTGYKRDEVVGKTSRELDMWSSSTDHQKLREAQQDSKGYRNLELHLKTKNGDLKNVVMSAAVIRLDGDEGYLKMFYDVTDRKQTEEDMHRAVQAVMNDASWFSRSLLEQLAHIRTGGQTLPSVDLSKRERQVLGLMAGGRSNDAIARELELRPQTVRNYVAMIYDKLGVHTRPEAIVWARERGITGK